MSKQSIDYQAELARGVAKWQEFEATLADQELLDEDGYPTDIALQAIQQWHWTDVRGWFEFIHSIWWMADWGWTETYGPDEHDPEKAVTRISMATGGWSGNESCIRAMQSNNMMWHLNWLQSRRGGHYIFELREFGDE